MKVAAPPNITNMRTIYKYPLELVDYQRIGMPSGAKILCVQEQDGRLCLWAKVFIHSGVESETRLFHIFGTGNPMPEMTKLIYIGTAQSGRFVWHVFEEPNL